MDSYGKALSAAVLERFRLLEKFDFSISDPVDLVRAGLIDPMRIFVKNDPHTLKKIEEKRLRLIFSVSYIDNLVARVLFENQNHAERDEWKNIPLKPGMGLNDEGLADIISYVRLALDAGLELVNTDVSAWDWSFSESDYQSDLKRRVALNHSEGTAWETIAQAHYYCMARAVVVASNGEMLAQSIPGVMKSGWYNTASTNTAVRAILHYDIAIKQKVLPWIMAMGDDSLERKLHNMEYEYMLKGKKTKGFTDVLVNPMSFEFCSTLFNPVTGVPLGAFKSLMKFLQKVPINYISAVDEYQQLMYELRNSDYPELFSQVISDSGYWLQDALVSDPAPEAM